MLLRPLIAEPIRSSTTIFAVAVGVAVVVAIDLAGEASAGSFRSSMENLSGAAQWEISAVGGLDEQLIGQLAALPYPLRFSARVAGMAGLPGGGAAPLFGLDLIGDPMLNDDRASDVELDPSEVSGEGALWAGRALGVQTGETLALTIGDRDHEVKVAGVLTREGFPGVMEESLLVTDITVAQRLLAKLGRLDRIEVLVPPGKDDWESILREALPAGVQLDARGTRTSENRRMLNAFRWNLRVLSWISLVVGAFLIYNAISVSVVRRRNEIGVLRALGATRKFVAAAFLAEAACLGAVGTLLGAALGRLLADGTVEMMARTVSTLYVSSAPGEIVFSSRVLVTALAAGIGVSILAALAPALEAARVAPSEAMARGRRSFVARFRLGRDMVYAGILALSAVAASFAPPIVGLPVLGYVAALLLLAASALAVPAMVVASMAISRRWVGRVLGIEGFLGSRSLVASLDRTAVLVGALSTAAAMLVSVGVMVGSFRETVIVWMDDQLRADLYVRPAGRAAVGEYPTMGSEIADRIESLASVGAVDRFRAYSIRYGGLPASLGGGDVSVHGRASSTRFLRGDRDEAFRRLRTEDAVIVSEPFAEKHKLEVGDELRLPLGAQEVAFAVVGIYYDYSNERGWVITDRERLMRYLPDPRPSNLAVYLREGADVEETRKEILRSIGESRLFVAENGRLREAAIEVFDRTFAITYALEAVAVAIAVMGMAGALAVLIIDRRREIATLRFLGASALQIRRIILIESGLLGLLANGLGAALGTALSLILIFVINKQSFGWTIQFHWPVGLLLTALGGVYLASVAAGLAPARAAVRLNPIEVIHEE